MKKVELWVSTKKNPENIHVTIFFENIERHVEKPMIFFNFHIRHSKYYITTYLQAIYRDHYVTSN